MGLSQRVDKRCKNFEEHGRESLNFLGQTISRKLNCGDADHRGSESSE